MTVKQLTEHHLEFLSLMGGYIGSSESTLVKMPHCWKSHVVAHVFSIRVENSCVEPMIIWFHQKPADLDHQQSTVFSKWISPGFKVIKLEFILRLKIKHNDWLLADTCPQAAYHCALL